jgi:hypothetical protein
MRPWLRRTHHALEELFADKPIVLVDVGASGDPPADWRTISVMSTFLGFDPDMRELKDDNSFGFRRFIMVNKAVLDSNEPFMELYLTAEPHCSSVLKPNAANLTNYDCDHLFEVEGKTRVAATRLDASLRSQGIAYVDWLKLDTQGKDLDIYGSLDEPTRARLLAVDIEPGIIDFYEGENTFAPAHARLIGENFWLARLHVQHASRIKRSTREVLKTRGIEVARLPGSPTALEATYFRSLEQLASVDAGLREHACLWLFAMLSDRSPFALDVAVAVIEKFDKRLGELLLVETLSEIRSPRRRLAGLAKNFPRKINRLFGQH